MIAFIQRYLIIGLLVLLLISGLIGLFYYHKFEVAKAKSESYQSLYRTEQNSNNKLWIDKKNQHHLESDAGITTIKSIFKEEIANNPILKDLQTKVNKLDGFRISKTESKYNFYTHLRDSIIISQKHDTSHVKISSYTDPNGWFKFKEIIQGDSASGELSSLDTAVTGLSKGKCQNRILWGLIGISNRSYKVEIVNKNPFVKTTYQKEVYLK